MTYTGIATLVILGDDLSRLDRKAIIEGDSLGDWSISPISTLIFPGFVSLLGVASVQRTDGSFSASVEGNEFDMRFVYCACCICYMLNDWGRVNKTQMGQYILSSLVS